MNMKPLLSVCLLVSSVCVAGERITPITGDLKGKTTFGNMYVAAPEGMVTAARGNLPVVEHLGRPAMKVQVNQGGDYWSLGLAREWTRFYLADYLPDGMMEVTVCGEAGGETFNVGVGQDANRYRKTEGHTPTVAIGNYGVVSKEWQTIRVPLKEIAAAAPGVDLDDCIKVLVSSTGPAKPETFYIAEIRFTTTSPEQVYPPIKINQLGYRPGGRKLARISTPVTEFRVVDVATGKAVFSGQAKPFATADKASGDDIWEADLTTVTAPGKYRLECGKEVSDTFEIREDIYDRLFADAMRFYYLQRCNMKLEERYAGEQAHDACHVADAKAKTVDGKEVRDVTGGWHDAGDNNKYPAFLPHVLPQLLLAYDMRPASFTDGQLNIPESGNGVSDMVDEIQYELDWLLKMQITDGPQAGAVYDRIHQSAATSDDPNPGKLQEPRRLLPPTDHSTAVSAASWALAARVLSPVPQLKEASAKYLAAAQLAWGYLERQKASERELLLPAACLFDATGDEKYAQIVARELDRLHGPQDWAGHMADRMQFEDYTFAVCALAVSEHDAVGVREKARRIVKNTADFVAGVSAKDGYGSPLWIMDHYCWSSTADLGRYGAISLIANRLWPDQKYVDTAQNVLDYTLGRNAVNTSFVTRYGTRWSEIFHDIYGHTNVAILPMPAGYVPGGVNMQNSRGISAYPAKHYRPDANNWTINEPALYYNAPLVFIAGSLAELKPAK